MLYKYGIVKPLKSGPYLVYHTERDLPKNVTQDYLLRTVFPEICVYYTKEDADSQLTRIENCGEGFYVPTEVELEDFLNKPYALGKRDVLVKLSDLSILCWEEILSFNGKELEEAATATLKAYGETRDD